MPAGMLAAVATFVLASLLVQFWADVSCTLKQAFGCLRRFQVCAASTSALHNTALHCSYRVVTFALLLLAFIHVFTYPCIHPFML